MQLLQQVQRVRRETAVQPDGGAEPLRGALRVSEREGGTVPEAEVFI
jgi:hypothetical protein